MRYVTKAIGVFVLGGLTFAVLRAHAENMVSLKSAMDSIVQKVRPEASRELPSSAPRVRYVVKRDGSVEFHVPADFQGVAITPDGRNLYLAN